LSTCASGQACRSATPPCAPHTWLPNRRLTPSRSQCRLRTSRCSSTPSTRTARSTVENEAAGIPAKCIRPGHLQRAKSVLHGPAVSRQGSELGAYQIHSALARVGVTVVNYFSLLEMYRGSKSAAWARLSADLRGRGTATIRRSATTKGRHQHHSGPDPHIFRQPSRLQPIYIAACTAMPFDRAPRSSFRDERRAATARLFNIPRILRGSSSILTGPATGPADHQHRLGNTGRLGLHGHAGIPAEFNRERPLLISTTSTRSNVGHPVSGFRRPSPPSCNAYARNDTSSFQGSHSHGDDFR